ncbi:uncharacterized protein [Montipora foliosa]|uniref:uncharacterized protein n=1 Tax=Montipora foliosa TaxID=591990 RepID=UPI0035F12AA5
MPESVVALKKENQALKAQVESLSQAMQKFQAKATAELKQARSRLDELIVKIIGQAVNKIEEYNYKFNLKLVGLPEIKEKESAEETSSLCVKLFREMGAEVTIHDINMAYRVPTREEHGGPKPIVCKFVRRLARNNLRPANLGLAESVNLSNVRIFDHLTPRMQSILYEAKRFKTQH